MMTSQKTKKRYSDDFKRDALRLLETSGKSVSAIERELRITHGLTSQVEETLSGGYADRYARTER